MNIDSHETPAWTTPKLVEISKQGRINSGTANAFAEDAESNPSGAA